MQINGLIHWKQGSLLLYLICLTACSQKHSYRDLESYVATLKKSVIASSFDPVLPVPRKYQANNLRSPFISTGAVSKKDPANPLQDYPVTMLRFAGTVHGSDTIMAYILTPDNLVYEVKVGDFIGDHGGTVVSIQPGQLKIMEKEQSVGKPVVEHVVTLQLKDEG